MGNLFDLTGKVAVITGSTKGIGKAMAQRMAEHGAKVVISSRKADICDQVASEITAAGGTAMAIPCNISDESQLQNLVDKTIAAWGGIDVLVCNAAAHALHRLGEPDDIAGIAVYLAAPSGRWTTGQTFVIDGGSTITSRY